MTGFISLRLQGSHAEKGLFDSLRASGNFCRMSLKLMSSIVQDAGSPSGVQRALKGENELETS